MIKFQSLLNHLIVNDLDLTSEPLFILNCDEFSFATVSVSISNLELDP